MSDLGYERAYFERGFIAAYAWAATKLPSGQINDAVIDRAWDHRDVGMDEADRLPMPSANWRCFHCNAVFTDRAQAAQHFGVSEEQQPACQIKGSEGGLLRVLRDTEDALFNATAALHAESADGLQAYRANLSRHAVAMRAAEETGYSRGLADGAIPAGFTLTEREHDDECGCPEEMWDTPYGLLNMHLSAGQPSNAVLDNGDAGEWDIAITADTVDAARTALFAWATFAAFTPQAGDVYLIWSNEHRAWWAPEERGYTRKVSRAGRYPREHAFKIAATRGGGWPVDGNPYEVAMLERDAVEQASA